MQLAPGSLVVHLHCADLIWHFFGALLANRLLLDGLLALSLAQRHCLMPPRLRPTGCCSQANWPCLILAAARLLPEKTRRCWLFGAPLLESQLNAGHHEHGQLAESRTAPVTLLPLLAA